MDIQHVPIIYCRLISKKDVNNNYINIIRFSVDKINLIISRFNKLVLVETREIKSSEGQRSYFIGFGDKYFSSSSSNFTSHFTSILELIKR